MGEGNQYQPVDEQEMKRPPLHRKTPLARGESQLKRSPLKKRSKRYAKVLRETNPARQAYVAEIGDCVCGKPACDPHEIAAGSSREKALQNRFAWLALCRECHERIQGSDQAEQYALKALQDPTHYDRVGLNILRRGPKATDAVSEVDVIHGLKRLFDRGVL